MRYPTETEIVGPRASRSLSVCGCTHKLWLCGNRWLRYWIVGEGVHAAVLRTDVVRFMQLQRDFPTRGSRMELFRCYFCIEIIVLASLAGPMSYAFAQRENMTIGDQ